MTIRKKAICFVQYTAFSKIFFSFFLWRSNDLVIPFWSNHPDVIGNKPYPSPLTPVLENPRINSKSLTQNPFEKPPIDLLL